MNDAPAATRMSPSRLRLHHAIRHNTERLPTYAQGAAAAAGQDREGGEGQPVMAVARRRQRPGDRERRRAALVEPAPRDGPAQRGGLSLLASLPLPPLVDPPPCRHVLLVGPMAGRRPSVQPEGWRCCSTVKRQAARHGASRVACAPPRCGTARRRSRTSTTARRGSSQRLCSSNSQPRSEKHKSIHQ